MKTLLLTIILLVSFNVNARLYKCQEMNTGQIMFVDRPCSGNTIKIEKKVKAATRANKDKELQEWIKQVDARAVIAKKKAKAEQIKLEKFKNKYRSKDSEINLAKYYAKKSEDAAAKIEQAKFKAEWDAELIRQKKLTVDFTTRKRIAKINTMPDSEVIVTARRIITLSKPGLIWTLRLSNPEAEFTRTSLIDYVTIVAEEEKKAF